MYLDLMTVTVSWVTQAMGESTAPVSYNVHVNSTFEFIPGLVVLFSVSPCL